MKQESSANKKKNERLRRFRQGYLGSLSGCVMSGLWIRLNDRRTLAALYRKIDIVDVRGYGHNLSQADAYFREGA